MNGLHKEDLTEINLAKVNAQDNWSLICDEFLDTEFEEDYKENSLKQLEESGIPRDEVFSIRKKINFRMMMLTYFSWEWIYYGQYDVLRELRPMSKKNTGGQ